MGAAVLSMWPTAVDWPLLLDERNFISQHTGWCESRGTVLFLSSVKTEMTDTIEIGLKILHQHLRYQKYIGL